MIAEPDVTLTDYALTLESGILAWLLHRMEGSRGQMRRWFIVFYGALGLAAFTGGTVHGFIHDQTALLHTVMWDSTLFAIGIAGLSAWYIATGLISNGLAAGWIRRVLVALFILYCVVVVAFVNTFIVAIVYYLPATVFLFFILGMQYLRSREGYFLSGVAGLFLTFAAAGVQQAGIALHPELLDHNALYHLIQAVALLLLFIAARGIIRYREA